MDQQKKKLNWIKLLAFPFFFAVILSVFFIFYKPLMSIFDEAGRESMKKFILSRGIWAPVVFILLQILQVVVFIIPGEVPQIAGGYLFGTLGGSLFSIIGIELGSAFNFYMARWLGIPFLRQILSEKKLEEINKISMSGMARISFFLLFLIPGIPKDMLCHVAGLTPMKFLSFLIISTLGRLPGIIVSAYMGEAAAEKKYTLVLILACASALLFFTGFFLRKKIEQWIASASRTSLKKERE